MLRRMRHGTSGISQRTWTLPSRRRILARPRPSGWRGIWRDGLMDGLELKSGWTSTVTSAPRSHSSAWWEATRRCPCQRSRRCHPVLLLPRAIRRRPRTIRRRPRTIRRRPRTRRSRKRLKTREKRSNMRQTWSKRRETAACSPRWSSFLPPY